MLNPIASLSVYLLEFLVAYTYFSNLLRQRFSTAKVIFIGILLFFFCSELNLLSQNNTTLNLCASCVASILFALFCFHGTLTQDIFYSVVLVVLNTALEIIVLSFGSFVTGSAFLDYNNDLLLFLVEALCSKGVYFLLF